MMLNNRENLSILLVDDDVDICQNMADILNDYGCHVDIAHDGMAALNLVRRKAYDVALLDLKMPGMDGFTLYQEVKKISPGTAVIIITAHAGSAVVEEALATGALQVFSKPIDLLRLMQELDKTLDQPLVLIVDDDLDLCDNLWDLLRDRGYRVFLAHNESQAAARLNDRSYKVVLIDVRLPNGSGSQVFHRVREMNPQARTILITGYSSDTIPLVESLLAEGADAIHYKPFDVPMLLSTLDRLA